MLKGREQKNATSIVKRFLKIEPITATNAGAKRNTPVLIKTSLLRDAELYGLLKFRTSQSTIVPKDERMPKYLQYFTLSLLFKSIFIHHKVPQIGSILPVTSMNIKVELPCSSSTLSYPTCQWAPCHKLGNGTTLHPRGGYNAYLFRPCATPNAITALTCWPGCSNSVLSVPCQW